MGARWYAPAIGRWVSADPLFIEDPGKNVDGPLEGSLYLYSGNNPIMYSDPTGLEASVMDCAITSQDVYDNSLDAYYEDKGWEKTTFDLRSTGYRRVTPDELNKMGLSASDFSNEQSGFHAGLYVKNGEYILAFRGTEGQAKLGKKARKDWNANSTALVSSKPPSQYISAMDLAKKILDTQNISPNNLTITGHSLGGALAARASIATHSAAITFNAAALTSDLRKYALNKYAEDSEFDPSILYNTRHGTIGYFINGEALTAAQGWLRGKKWNFKNGLSISLPFTGVLPTITHGAQIGIDPVRKEKPLRMHEMDFMILSLKKANIR
jgi:hypothetical protein